MAAVGRMAGVSQVTVSRALSDPAKVSPETLARIEEAIAATGFVPNAVAGALASARSRLVSALIPSLTNITYTAFIKEFTERLRQADYQVLLSECGFDPAGEEETVARHLSRRPDAMLLTGISHSSRTRKMLLAAGIPVVEIWDMTESPIDVCVGFSHVEAGRAAADFALDAGYSTAACVAAPDLRALRRAAAFADRFSARSGAEVPTVNLTVQASLAGGRLGLARLLDEIDWTPGVVFCSSDMIAQGILVEAQARGLKVPRDVAVIGFGDQEIAAHLEPPLTSVRVDRGRMGQEAASALLDRIGSAPGNAASIDLGFEVIRRGST
ncbi:substrate-binding domain-containing protein [Rhodobacterales bacterium HKCCE2091]|nr:substrate-binding domain-containing protein [Rhodobacterales bacterium HKCCE2091]